MKYNDEKIIAIITFMFQESHANCASKGFVEVFDAIPKSTHKVLVEDLSPFLVL